MQASLDDQCCALLTELGFVTANSQVNVEPLTGGVASDIAMVEVGDQKLCVKFALPKLKVEADWFAPVHRNTAEYEWLKFAAKLAPKSAVRLFGRSEELHGFAMEFLEGKDIYLWKSALLSEAAGQNEAAKVGDLLGRVHSASTQSGFDESAFQNWGDFNALRIEPYLSYTATQHRDISEELETLSDQLFKARQVLVHGDVSPKNILFRAGNPIILDAECATIGDATFDPSFCLNHLVLKAIHLPNSRERNLKHANLFWQAYAPHITWETAHDTEARVCKLVPALMLGRVDGKSPVEYLTGAERKTVRQIAKYFIASPVKRFEDLIQGIDTHLKEMAA